MDNIVIVETANHVCYGVHFPDVQELIAKTLTFGGSFDKPAISTNSKEVGITFKGVTNEERIVSRSSGH